MSENNQAALFAHDVRKEYGEVVALHDLRLEVRRGELVALVGPNGAGKSTFLRCAAGLLEPSDGILLATGSQTASMTHVFDGADDPQAEEWRRTVAEAAVAASQAARAVTPVPSVGAEGGKHD